LSDTPYNGLVDPVQGRIGERKSHRNRDDASREGSPGGQPARFATATPFASNMLTRPTRTCKCSIVTGRPIAHGHGRNEPISQFHSNTAAKIVATSTPIQPRRVSVGIW
jgi:hypothetical protein